NPWAVNCAFIRLQIRIGMEKVKQLGLLPDPLPRFNRHSYQDEAGMNQARKEQKVKIKDRDEAIRKLAVKHGPKYCLYHLRHSWLDRALKSGLDALTCAIIMGHRDPSTLAKVYQHLSQSPSYLHEQVKKVRA